MRIASFLLLLLLPVTTLAQSPSGNCCWAGVYATTVTPWKACQAGVDTASLTKQLEYQLAGGIDGVLVLGTLGEGMYANEAERLEVISTAATVVKAPAMPGCGSPKLLVGIHTGKLDRATQQAKVAESLGADALVVKYLGCPNTPFCEVLGFFQELAAATRLPIFYYHHPSDMPRKLCPAEVGQILSLPQVVGVKESTLSLREVQEHMAMVCGQGKVFLSGTLLNATQFKAIGGHGAICPEAALLPCGAMETYVAVYGNDSGRRKLLAFAAGRQEQRDLFVLAPVLQGGLITAGGARGFTMFSQDLKLPQPLPNETAQARMKYFLNEMGVCTSSEVKPCLPALTTLDQIRVDAAVRKVQR